MSSTSNAIAKILLVYYVVFHNTVDGYNDCPIQEMTNNSMTFNCSAYRLKYKKEYCVYIQTVVVDYAQSDNVNITAWWTNQIGYETPIQLSVFCNGNATACARTKNLPWTPTKHKIQEVSRADRYTVNIATDLRSVPTLPTLHCHNAVRVDINISWPPNPTSKPPKKHESRVAILTVAIALPVLFVLLLSIIIICYCIQKLLKKRNYPVTPFDDSVILGSADVSNDQLHVLTTTGSIDPSNNLQASQTLPLASPIQVYLSHPTSTEDSKLKLMGMIKEFHLAGIECKAAFTNTIPTAERGYAAIGTIMKEVNFILICCDEERLQAMKRLTEDLPSELTAPFQPFRREADLIDAEHANAGFTKIIVILMEEASFNCIQGIFRTTTHYKYPDEFDGILARLQKVEYYQLPPLLSRHSSSHS